MRALLVAASMGFCLVCVGSVAMDTPEDPAPAEEAAPSLEERVREILSTPAEEGVDRIETRCIRSMDYHRVDVLDNQRLVFQGRGDKRWLNQLRMRCPGLNRRDVLEFEMRSMRLCEMDTFRSVDPSGYGMKSGGCSLGSFEPVTPDQVQMLKDALKAERDAKR